MEMTRFWLGRAVCAAAAVALILVSAAHADEIEFCVMRQGSTYYAEIMATVEGGTSVQMQKSGDAEWTEFEKWDDEFEIESDTYATLADLNSETVGSYTLQVVHSGGTSEYAFDIQSVEDAWFTTNPVLDPVPDEIPQQYEFSWTWDGTAELKYVEYTGWSPEEYVDFEQEYESGDPGFDDKSLLADFGTLVGSGDFFIVYGDESNDLVTDWTLQSGSGVFGGVGPAQYIASEDVAEFLVVPEPATMGLLVLGGLALMRRRRTA